MGNNFGVTDEGIIYANSANIKGAIYADTGTFNGTITAGDGNIGGWEIGPTSLITKDYALGAENGFHMYSAINNATHPTFNNGTNESDWRLVIGSKFAVTGSGTLHAENVQLTGEINATAGTLGAGWEIEGSTIKSTGYSGRLSNFVLAGGYFPYMYLQNSRSDSTFSDPNANYYGYGIEWVYGNRSGTLLFKEIAVKSDIPSLPAGLTTTININDTQYEFNNGILVGPIVGPISPS